MAYPNSGQVKLDTKVKDAQVFIDGSYAGTTHKNKTMRLRPGTYNIEIREGGQTPFSEKVYVVAGRTLPVFRLPAKRARSRKAPARSSCPE
jgi:hypothetical protein